MERLSHDLNLALEESNCGRSERRKIGLRRRTRSAGNLPAAVAVSIVEDESSSSPPQAPLITQPLSDSDEPELLHKTSNVKSRHYCQIGNFESDSFNENFSPTRPANARRKRKYKKMPVDYTNGKRSPDIEILSVTTMPNTLPQPIDIETQVISPANRTWTVSIIHNQKSERNTLCGKRKWSHRDKDMCEMRERSFSGGCSSKSPFFKLSKHSRKETVVQPGKIKLKPQNEEAKPSMFVDTPVLPGSSSFNFVYKSASKNGVPILAKMTGYKIPTDLPPFFSASTSKHCFDGKFAKKYKHLNKTHHSNRLRNPLLFDEEGGMDFAGNDSSSLSSSDSDGVVTNDSDREGDDELTDWPGIEDLKVFNKSLTFKTSKGAKKSKNLVYQEEETSKEGDPPPHFSPRRNSSFSSFSDIKNAGGSGQNANQKFFNSFQSYQEKSGPADASFSHSPRTNFALQKTSSSDLNFSEKSPISDHCYSEHSVGNAVAAEVREIRAGCRRIREERPGFLILSAANEQLSKFLQDSCQTELKLPSLSDPEEKAKLASLAKLYSLELQVEMGRPVLRKTSNTMQAIRVEHSNLNFPSEHKRRCYGDDTDASLSLSDQNSINDLDERQIGVTSMFDTFSNSLVDKSLLHPGEID